MKRIQEYFAYPDGRYGYLNAQTSFAALDPDKVTIKFFAIKPFDERSDAPEAWTGFGCVALAQMVNWPVTAFDAEHSISTFTCTKIRFLHDEWSHGY